MDRKVVDRIVSWTAVVAAVALIVLGGLAIYAGQFGQANVRDRLEPQKVMFAPASVMTAEEKAAVGDFAGQQVVNGPQAEAYSRLIGVHLLGINEGKTYAETSTASRAPGLDPKVAADLQVKADILFKGETLRSILLNAYGWWTVATISMWAGFTMLAAGAALVFLSLLGFRHARRVAKASGVVAGRPVHVSIQSAA